MTLEHSVAIVGMSCVFAKAPDLATFWENILHGVDALGEPPPSWGREDLYDPAADDNDHLYTLRGGYLRDEARFDPLAFGVMPRSVDGGEPEHFLALRLAHDALRDAGYLERPFDRTRAQIILGRGTYANRGFVTVLQHSFAVHELVRILGELEPSRSPRELAELKAALKAKLPPFNAETAPSLPHSVMCGRIANRLDLMGPAFGVDAACASTLVAVELGMKDLLAGKADLVLAGGVQISTTYPIALLFSQLGALSRSGQLRPFHPEADGTLLGEGAGVLVLRRLSDAVRAGDRIYAVVRGVGMASDGRATGLLAPRIEGEELALRRAYETAGVAPASIGLVEAHGTGTPVGDAHEIEALRRVFGEGGNGRTPVPLGSVKSMVGHAIPAAGAAGLIKAALAIYHRILPPTLHAVNPNPRLAGTPFFLMPEARPWVHAGDEPRRAAVSAFGFGGINGHAILEEPPTDGLARGRSAVAVARPAGAPREVQVHRRWPAELFVLAAGDREELAVRCEAVGSFAAARPDVELGALAASVAAGVPAASGAVVTAVATDHEDLQRKLLHAAERLRDPSCRRIQEAEGLFYFAEPLLGSGGRLALLFPGEGAQYRGMLRELALHFPRVRSWFDLMDRAFRSHRRGFLPSQVVYPVGEEAGPEGRLWEIDSAIEAVFTANQALNSLLEDLEVEAQAVVGHSTGEYSALLVSGAVEVADESQLVELVLEGNRATERALAAGLVPEGSLLTVGPASPELIRELTSRAEEALVLAIDNCPHQAVLCGSPEVVERTQEELRARGVVCQVLPFARAYHTPFFAPVARELEELFHRARFQRPRLPLYSCATAEAFPPEPEAVRELALRQWTQPVRFRETVEAMYRDGSRVFMEVGPRGSLSSFVRDTLKGRPHLAVGLDSARVPGLVQLQRALAMLVAHGGRARLDALWSGRDLAAISPEEVLSGRPRERPVDRSIVLSLELPRLELDRADRERFARPAAPPEVAPAPAATRPAADAAGRTRVLQQYLDTMEGFLALQRDMTAAFLRRADAVPRPVGPWVLRGARISRREGALAVRRQLETSGEEVFLRDHTLGGRVSVDDAVRALPVVPLALSLELMAEAAALLRPGLRPVRMEGVRVQRWLPCESTAAVEVSAVAGPRGDVRLRLDLLPGADAEAGLPVVEGVAWLASSPMPAPQRLDSPLRNPRPCRWTGEDLYREGLLHGMFHGPSLRGVVSVDAIGEDGVEGTLVAGDDAAVLRSPAARFLVLPLVLDAVSQLLGYWTAEVLEREFVVFPVGFERLELFADAVPAGARLSGRVDVREIEERRVRADLEVRGADGVPILRVVGWEVGRSRLPEAIYRFRLDPRGTSLGEPLDPGATDGLAAVRLDLPAGFLGEEEGIWTAALGALALGPAERLELSSLPPAERPGRLLESLAAKEAVRRLLGGGAAAPLFPADITLEERPGSWFRATTIGPDGRRWAPGVSVSRRGSVAVAVAGAESLSGRLHETARRLLAAASNFGSGGPSAFTTAGRQTGGHASSSAH